MMDNTQENETETNTAPMIAKKIKKRNISRYTLTMGVIKEQEDLKQEDGQGLTRKAQWNGKEEVK